MCQAPMSPMPDDHHRHHLIARLVVVLVELPVVTGITASLSTTLHPTMHHHQSSKPYARVFLHASHQFFWFSYDIMNIFEIEGYAADS